MNFSVFFKVRLKKAVTIASAVLLSPILFFLILLRRRKLQRGGRLKILVIPHVSRIGDLVCATPVFREIKKKYPASFLAVLVTDKVAGIIKYNPHIDEIIPYKTTGLWRITIKLVAAGRFDWSFNLAALSIGSAISLFGLITHRVKTIREGKPLGEIFTDWMNNYTLLYRHHTFLPAHYLKLLKFIGIDYPAEEKEVFTTPEADRKVETFFHERRVTGGDLVVGISITAGNKIKEWGDAKFKELAKRIVEKYNAKIVFLGGKSDEKRINSLLGSGKSFVDHCFAATDFSLEELPSLIYHLSLLIAVDTGPIYVAHALKIPLIDIIGPVDPTEQPPAPTVPSGPEDERSILVCPPAHIKPSSFVLKNPGKPEEHKKAIESITVEDVVAAVDVLIKRKAI